MWYYADVGLCRVLHSVGYYVSIVEYLIVVQQEMIGTHSIC